MTTTKEDIAIPDEPTPTDPKILADRIEEYKSEVFILGTLLTVAFAIIVFLAAYIAGEYESIKDVDGSSQKEMLLIHCQDGSSKWYPMPYCLGNKHSKKNLRECGKEN